MALNLEIISKKLSIVNQNSHGIYSFISYSYNNNLVLIVNRN